jgi:hypothetical protein
MNTPNNTYITSDGSLRFRTVQSSTLHQIQALTAWTNLCCEKISNECMTLERKCHELVLRSKHRPTDTYQNPTALNGLTPDHLFALVGRQKDLRNIEIFEFIFVLDFVRKMNYFLYKSTAYTASDPSIFAEKLILDNTTLEQA